MYTNYIITLFLYIVHKKTSPCSSPSPIVIRGTSPAFSIPCSSPRKKPSWHKTNWTFYVKDEDLPFRPNMWWRWGESNSRPKALSYRLLRAQFMFKLQIWADTNNRRPSYPGKISHSALQESGIRYPAIGPLFPQAGAK